MNVPQDLYTREELHKSVTLQMQSGDVSGAVQEFEVRVGVVPTLNCRVHAAGVGLVSVV